MARCNAPVLDITTNNERYNVAQALSDEQMVRMALAKVEAVASNAAKGRAIGVSEATIRRWLEGEIAVPLRRDTRIPLERFLGLPSSEEDRGGRPGRLLAVAREALGGYRVNQPEGEGHPSEEGAVTPAEQLLEFLSQRLGHRRVAGELTDKDLIAAAYTLARKHGFTSDDYRILDRWRDQIIQTEKG